VDDASETGSRSWDWRRAGIREVSLSRCIRYGRVCACARFGAGGHTFNFARPITKSDMHHSEINSQQQRAHVLFVMSRSNSPERAKGRERRGGGQRGKWAPPWWQVVVISRVSSQLMTTPGARLCPAYPMYISCLSTASLASILFTPIEFCVFVCGHFEKFCASGRQNGRGNECSFRMSIRIHFSVQAI